MDSKEKIEREKELERLGQFNEHITPPISEKLQETDANYKYIRKGFFKKIGSFFAVGIFRFAGDFMSPYCRLKIIGKENVKGIKKAILTSNHINDIDCVLIKHAFKRKPLKIVVADFNNPKGMLGAFLRAGGTLPIGNSVVAMKNFTNAISHYLDKENYVLFYPERAEWWCYAKPRPMLRGAFYYAVKNDVPIIPMFFTFKDRKKLKNGVPKKKFYLHIGKPIYMNKELNQNDAIQDLMNRTFEYNKGIYENFYNKKLTYDTETNKE